MHRPGRINFRDFNLTRDSFFLCSGVGAVYNLCEPAN